MIHLFAGVMHPNLNESRYVQGVISDKIHLQTSICALQSTRTSNRNTNTELLYARGRLIERRGAQMSDQVIIKEPTVASVCATCQIDCVAASRPFILRMLGYEFIPPCLQNKASPTIPWLNCSEVLDLVKMYPPRWLWHSYHTPSRQI